MANWVEEGLVARGAEPPEGDDWTRADWLMVPPGSFLPFTKRELMERLLNHQPESIDRDVVRACLKMTEHLVNVRAVHILDELKEDFAYFDPTLPAPPDSSPEELDRREHSFLSNLLLALVKGNFIPMSDFLYRKAIDQRFVLDIPITVRWDRLDGQPIQQFVDFVDSTEGETLRKEMGLDTSLRDFIKFPDAFEERALVFHRGLSPLRSEGTFVAAKLDLLLSKIIGVIAFPVVYLVERFMDDGSSKPIEEPIPDPNERNAPRRRWVRRLGLENVPLTSLFKKARLQEPAFREIVVIFRQLKSAALSPLEKFRSKSGENEDDGRRQLQIKIFRDIPLADAEIVFPENSPRMRTIDAVLLTVTAIAALPAVFRAIATGGGTASLVVAVVLGVYISKVVGQYFRARNMRLARMTKELYHKTRDNDLGVLQYLVDASQEQDFKEAALVYGVLLPEKKPLTAEEADDLVEEFLHQKFSGLDVDFEIDDALRKAVGEGSMQLLDVIEGEDGQKRYQARPPEVVFDTLQEAWRDFSEALRPDSISRAFRPASTKQPPLEGHR